MAVGGIFHMIVVRLSPRMVLVRSQWNLKIENAWVGMSEVSYQTGTSLALIKPESSDYYT